MYSSKFLNGIKLEEPEKFWELKKSQGKNERACQRMDVQNHAYDKSRRTYVRDVRLLSNIAAP